MEGKEGGISDAAGSDSEDEDREDGFDVNDSGDEDGVNGSRGLSAEDDGEIDDRSEGGEDEEGVFPMGESENGERKLAWRRSICIL